MSLADHPTPDLIIVGGGPRALYALADLEEVLADRDPHPRGPLHVTVVEPGTPGAGAVWEPSQPGHLMMNVHHRIVDATCPSVPLTLAQWQEREGSTETFPARALAGRYLAWAFGRLAASPWLDVTHMPATVTHVRREDGLWVCQTADAVGAVAALRAPRVLLATGHAGGAGLDHAAIASPVTGPRPGARVTVQGAALTAFDVVLDLTAGRGGTWAGDGPDLRYVPSGDEPAQITLVSRSGEPMLPKPVSVPTSVTAAVRARTGRWLPDAVPDDAWWDVLADAAVAAALEAGERVTHHELWERLTQATARGVAGADGTGEDPAARWERDAARALGDVDGDPAWWWGRAWAAGYADVVRSLERGPRDGETWTRWRARAAALERWAFGPPLATHTRLMALREAGLLTVVVPGAAGLDAASGEDLIDAFTRGPGVLDAPLEQTTAIATDRAPWDGLVAAGEVSVREGERGVLTARDGACLRADGTVNAGLAALGRPTEDPVIGHDSLQRHLHDDSRRWAQALVREWARADSAARPEAVVAHG